MNAILSSLGSADRPVVLPVHPRTRARLDAAATPLAENIRLIDPLSYLEMLQLERAARIILTDSGGVQKEAYWMAVPCITLRDETEWTELVATGCNRLASADADAIARALSDFEQREAQLPADRPTDLYGDGNAAGRIAECLIAAATG
jgi:UDP-N-acetylglucosamine 2-epimerase